MTANQHESAQRGDRYTTHILELCLAFDVKIIPMDAADTDKAAALTLQDKPLFEERTRIIRIAEPNNEPAYAAALHELGHLLHPVGRVARREGSLTYRTTGVPSLLRDVRLMIDQEQAAWEWAHQYALEWTEVMTFVEVTCMSEYFRVARRYGVKP